MSIPSSRLKQEHVAWPPLRADSGEGDSLFYARSFGDAPVDIDIEFLAVSQPEVVTRVLEECLFDDQGHGFTPDTIWQWTVKRRLQGLLAIAFASFGNRLNLTSHCQQTGCGEQLEIELQLEDFIDIDDLESIHCEPVPGVSLTLRHPVGLDQILWQQHAREQGSDGLSEYMCKTLIIDSEEEPESVAADLRISDSWQKSIDKALEKADSLTALSLSTRCPVCESENDIALDLERRILSLLAARQRQRLEHVHLIASVYHWSEQEVMQLPPARRNFYVERITGAVTV